MVLKNTQIMEKAVYLGEIGRMKPARYLRLLTMLLFLSGSVALAQNKYIPPDPYTHWDGVSHWSEYMVLSPAYMGPNALPVPYVRDGLVPSSFNWSGLYEYAYGQGDLTHDFTTNLLLPLAGGRVGLELIYTPVEFFSMDSTVSRQRRTFSGEAAENFSLGDVYFGTIVQLIREHRFLPDLTFSMACKTASGTGREYSRHTDTPGYYLDLAAGRSFGTGRRYLEHVRVYGMAGFYVWQTYLDNYPQNDALLYGLGVNFVFRDFSLEQSLRGYSGYMANGDHPLVYRAELGIRSGDARFVIGYERGLRDYPFQGIRTGIVIKPTGITRAP